MEKTIRRCLSAASEGKMTKKDFNDLLKIAEFGEYRAQCCVARMYFSGANFVKQDYKKSFEWFLKSAKQNHFWSQYQVGLMYWEGKGVERNEERALEWLKKSSVDEAQMLVKEIEHRRANLLQNSRNVICRFLDITKNVVSSHKYNFFTKAITEVKKFEFSETPDTPISFCYKIMWMAIKTNDTDYIVKNLKLRNTRKANWETGFAAAYECRSDWTFVTPPIKGWVFVINNQFDIFSMQPEQTKSYKLILEIAQKVPELYFFSSHRVSECHCWMCIKNGKLERMFCYGDGEILCEKGEITKEEIKCGLNFEKLRNNEWDEDTVLPNEESVHAISSTWTIDTLELENMTLEKSTGTVGVIDYKGDN